MSALRLARTLGVEPAALPAEVRALDAPALAGLADDVSADLHEDEGPGLRALVGLVDLLPTGVVAGATEARLEPRFAARLAGHLPPAGGQSLVARLSTTYLAQTAVHLELPRCAPLLASLPPAKIAAVACELAEAGRFAVAAEVADLLPEPSLRAAVEALDDAAVAAIAAHGSPELRERAHAALGAGRRGVLGAAAA